jgi:hypothetical protein
MVSCEDRLLAAFSLSGRSLRWTAIGPGRIYLHGNRIDCETGWISGRLFEEALA